MTLIKEMKDDRNRWRESPCSWVGRINVVEMTMLPSANHRFSVPVRSPVAFPQNQNKKFHNSCGNTKDPE